MSLDKAIKHGKEKRKPYKGSKKCSVHCRNHGSCGRCLKDRTYRNNKELEKAKYEEKPL